MRPPILFVACVSCLGLAGCGTGLKPLAGVVVVDGRPAMKGVRVQFVPLGDTRPAEGTVDETGAFRVRSVTQAGVMPGEYRVCLLNSVESIRRPDTPAADADERTAAGIAPKGWAEYQAAVTTFLDKPPTGPGWIPKFYSSPATTPLRWNSAKDGFDLRLEVSAEDKPAP